MAGGSIQVPLTQLAGVESVGSGAALEGDASVQPAAAVAAAAAAPATAASEVAGTTATMTATSTATTVPVEAAAAAAAEGQEHATGAQDENGGRSDDDAGSGGDVDDVDDDGGDDDSQQEEVDDAKEARLRQAVVLSSPVVIRRVAEKLEGYRLPADRVEELRETFKGFLGTKNYHNYTNHKKAADPSCKRYVPYRKIVGGVTSFPETCDPRGGVTSTRSVCRIPSVSLHFIVEIPRFLFWGGEAKHWRRSLFR